MTARVLIVDDDEDIRHVLHMLFETTDFEVVGEAGDGINALAQALKHSPDVVILDYMMPGMTGDKVAEQLRATLPQTKIVAFSAILDRKPDWADAYLDKARVGEVAPLIAALIPES